MALTAKTKTDFDARWREAEAVHCVDDFVSMEYVDACEEWRGRRARTRQ